MADTTPPVPQPNPHRPPVLIDHTDNVKTEMHTTSPSGDIYPAGDGTKAYKSKTAATIGSIIGNGK